MHVLIHEWAAKNDLTITETQQQMLQKHQDMVLYTNKHMNLTAITAPDEFATKHIIDSLTLLPYIPQNAQTLADIGTGAGYPGLVLAIMRPNLRVVLLDSLRKRVRFLQEVVDELGLTNVECLHARAEELAPTGIEFDICTARAVASMDKLAKWILPLVSPGGTLLTMKGPDVQDELAAAEKILAKRGGVVQNVDTMEIAPGIAHSIVVVSKLASIDN